MMKKLLLTIIIYITTLAGAVGLYAQDEATALPQPEKTDFFGLAYNNMFLLIAFIVLTLVVFAAINLIWALIDMQNMEWVMVILIAWVFYCMMEIKTFFKIKDLLLW